MPRVLIVDDEPDFRELTASLLERDGFEVRTAGSARAAEAVAAEFRPDVLVVDWILKGTAPGAMIARKLFDADPRLQIVAISGLPKELLREEARDLQLFAVLEKPFDAADLKAAVDQALRAGSGAE